MSQKLKFHNNWNVSKTEISLKLENKNKNSRDRHWIPWSCLYRSFFFVLSWTLCMAGEQWIAGFVWHWNIIVTKYQPRAMIEFYLNLAQLDILEFILFHIYCSIIGQLDIHCQIHCKITDIQFRFLSNVRHLNKTLIDII